MWNKIGSFFVNLGRFLRLIDEQNCLSLTNIAVYIALVKISLIQDMQMMDAGLILISLLNYAGKKVIGKMKNPPKVVEITPEFEERFRQIENHCIESHNRIEQMSNKISSVGAAVGLTRTKLNG